MLGNGASIAVYDSFSYGSLYEAAKNLEEESDRLNPRYERIFDKFEANDFELVLESLYKANIVNKSLDIECESVEEAYKSIRNTLIKTVKDIHLRKYQGQELFDDILKAICTEIEKYDRVFTTNYDLILYWAVMQSCASFEDYFRNGEFDLSSLSPLKMRTKIFYLHGGLHLYAKDFGGTRKRTARENKSLLDLFGEPFSDGVECFPLFVAEGDSENKISAISRSNYLEFAYNQLIENDENIVVFGHSLSECDQHILDAIKTSKPNKLAISIYAADKQDVNSVEHSILAKFPGFEKQIVFFDARSHPLGSESLKFTDEKVLDRKCEKIFGRM